MKRAYLILLFFLLISCRFYNGKQVLKIDSHQFQKIGMLWDLENFG